MGKKNPVGPRQKPIYKRHGMLCKSIESSISYICTPNRVIARMGAKTAAAPIKFR